MYEAMRKIADLSESLQDELSKDVFWARMKADAEILKGHLSPNAVFALSDLRTGMTDDVAPCSTILYASTKGGKP